jgi:hypothetical protein
VSVLGFLLVVLVFIQVALQARAQWRKAGNRFGAGGMIVYGLLLLALAYWQFFLR